MHLFIGLQYISFPEFAVIRWHYCCILVKTDLYSSVFVRTHVNKVIQKVADRLFYSYIYELYSQNKCSLLSFSIRIAQSFIPSLVSRSVRLRFLAFSGEQISLCRRTFIQRLQRYTREESEGPSTPPGLERPSAKQEGARSRRSQGVPQDAPLHLQNNG